MGGSWTHKTLEQVRIRVVRQVERGARPEYLASVLGFCPFNCIRVDGTIPGGWHGCPQKLGPYPADHRNSLDLSYAKSTLLL